MWDIDSKWFFREFGDSRVSKWWVGWYEVGGGGFENWIDCYGVWECGWVEFELVGMVNYGLVFCKFGVWVCCGVEWGVVILLELRWCVWGFWGFLLYD